MEVSKDQVLEFVRERRGSDEMARAERELPDRVDTEQDARLLSKFGVNPLEVLSQFNGGITRS